MEMRFESVLHFFVASRLVIAFVDFKPSDIHKPTQTCTLRAVLRKNHEQVLNELVALQMQVGILVSFLFIYLE